MTADIRLVIKPKNARICRAMEAMGYHSAAELCHGLGLRVGGSSYYQLLDLCNFRLKPITKDGAWAQRALTVASLLQVEPGDLWPEYLREVELRRGTFTSIDVTVEQLAGVQGGEQEMIDRDFVAKLLARLPAREKFVVEMHYGFNGKGAHTFKEIGESMGLTVEGARRYESKAMRRFSRWTKPKTD